MKQASLPLYIRFGELPPDGKSKVHRSDDILRDEGGLSVWRAVEANYGYYPILPEDANESAIADYFDFLLNDDSNVYLVTGTEMCIEGADREPLLMDVKVLEDITYLYRKNKNPKMRGD